MGNTAVIKLTHDYGMRKLRALKGVISATHIERKKYIQDKEGKSIPSPEYIIKVRVKLKSGKIFDREIKLTDHPNAIGVKEYNYIIQHLFINDGQ